LPINVQPDKTSERPSGDGVCRRGLGSWGRRPAPRGFCITRMMQRSAGIIWVCRCATAAWQKR